MNTLLSVVTCYVYLWFLVYGNDCGTEWVFIEAVFELFFLVTFVTNFLTDFIPDG